jgi:hypothetical protein
VLGLFYQSDAFGKRPVDIEKTANGITKLWTEKISTKEA